MRRLRWLAALLTLSVTMAGCAAGAEAPVVIPTVAGRASGQTLVAEWSQVGGFTSPGSLAVRPPRVVVYADGTAVADAESSLTLTPAEVTELVGALRTALRGLPAEVDSPRAQVMDAATSVLRVLRADASLQSVSAYALEVEDGYPGGLVAANRRLRELWQRVTQDGSAYTSTRVRLVAELAGDVDHPQGVPAWPADVPVPAPVADQYGSAVYLLEATDAGPVRAHWPARYGQRDSWVFAVLPDGTGVRVTWRYLVPGE